MYMNEIEEICRAYLPVYLLFFLPIFILLSPANPVAASSEYSVYRLQHYDLHGLSHGSISFTRNIIWTYTYILGSRSASFSLEAKSLSGWSMSRHCVIARFQDLTIDSYKVIKSKVGALLAMLPKNFNGLSQEEKHVRIFILIITFI